MGLRLEFQALLESFTANVYFQPPPNVQLQYPCIMYVRDDAEIEYADNKSYRYTTKYKVTIIDRDPDSVLPVKMASLPLCSFDRFFTADGLNHDVYNIFF